jgi:hypothetical protein
MIPEEVTHDFCDSFLDISLRDTASQRERERERETVR